MLQYLGKPFEQFNTLKLWKFGNFEKTKGHTLRLRSRSRFRRGLAVELTGYIGPLTLTLVRSSVSPIV